MHNNFQPAYLQFDYTKLAGRDWTALTVDRRNAIHEASNDVFRRLTKGEAPKVLLGVTILEEQLLERVGFFDGNFYAGYLWYSQKLECGFACYAKKSMRKFWVDGVNSGRDSLEKLKRIEVNGVGAGLIRP